MKVKRDFGINLKHAFEWTCIPIWEVFKWLFTVLSYFLTITPLFQCIQTANSSSSRAHIKRGGHIALELWIVLRTVVHQNQNYSNVENMLCYILNIDFLLDSVKQKIEIATVNSIVSYLLGFPNFILPEKMWFISFFVRKTCALHNLIFCPLSRVLDNFSFLILYQNAHTNDENINKKRHLTVFIYCDCGKNELVNYLRVPCKFSYTNFVSAFLV